MVPVAEDPLEVGNNPVNQALKCLASVAQTKQHLGIFTQAEWGNDGCFSYVCHLHGNLMITLLHVQFAEDAEAADSSILMREYLSGPVIKFSCLKSKAGHPHFKSAPPQLRNIADNQIDCGVAD
jgi:hypothetical protein